MNLDPINPYKINEYCKYLESENERLTKENEALKERLENEQADSVE